MRLHFNHVMKQKNKTTKSSKTSPRKPGKARPVARETAADTPTYAVIQTLEQAGRPLLFDELAVRVGASTSPRRKHLHAEIEHALHAGELVKNRRDEYCL